MTKKVYTILRTTPANEEPLLTEAGIRVDALHRIAKIIGIEGKRQDGETHWSDWSMIEARIIQKFNALETALAKALAEQEKG